MNPRPALSRSAGVALPVLACVTVAAMASPASAARPDSSSSVRSGTTAHVSWTELDPADALGLPGNTHIGFLGVQNGAYGNFAYGSIADFECEPGQVPSGHGDTGGCTFVQERFLDSQDGTLTVAGRTATFDGTVTVSNGGHGEPGSVLAQVDASIVWTSSTDPVRFRETHSYVEGKTSYRSRVTGTRSDVASTVVTGTLGRMGFADEADDVSVGSFSSFTETSRERMR